MTNDEKTVLDFIISDNSYAIIGNDIICVNLGCSSCYMEIVCNRAFGPDVPVFMDIGKNYVKENYPEYMI